MTKDELVEKLKNIARCQDDPEFSKAYGERIWGDQEMQHVEADSLLLKYINDPEIEEAYDSIGKWYA